MCLNSQLTSFAQVSEATKSLHKAHRITVPFPDPKPDKNAAYKLAYSKPSNINVVGSYALKNMVKTEDALSIDMVVAMPSSIFQEKDYLNYRYFYKRAYYLAYIAAGLQEKVKDEFELTFEYLHGNTLHPILVARPKSGRSDSLLVSGRSAELLQVIMQRATRVMKSKSFPLHLQVSSRKQNYAQTGMLFDRRTTKPITQIVSHPPLSTMLRFKQTAILSHISSFSMLRPNSQLVLRMPVCLAEFGYANVDSVAAFQTEGLANLSGQPSLPY